MFYQYFWQKRERSLASKLKYNDVFNRFKCLMFLTEDIHHSVMGFGTIQRIFLFDIFYSNFIKKFSLSSYLENRCYYVYN